MAMYRYGLCPRSAIDLHFLGSWSMNAIFHAVFSSGNIESFTLPRMKRGVLWSSSVVSTMSERIYFWRIYVGKSIFGGSIFGGSMFGNFSACADGGRRGLDGIGGRRRKGLGETRL